MAKELELCLAEHIAYLAVQQIEVMEFELYRLTQSPGLLRCFAMLRLLL